MDMHPIVFLYRHALEVYLKSILVFGNGVLLINKRPSANIERILGCKHDLRGMLPGAKSIFDLIDCSDIWIPPTFSSFADVERVVGAFDEIKHDAFRYPVDRAGSKELLEEPLCFNALVFAEKAEALMELLQKAAKRSDEAFQDYFPHMPS